MNLYASVPLATCSVENLMSAVPDSTTVLSATSAPPPEFAVVTVTPFVPASAPFLMSAMRLSCSGSYECNGRVDGCRCTCDSAYDGEAGPAQHGGRTHRDLGGLPGGVHHRDGFGDGGRLLVVGAVDHDVAARDVDDALRGAAVGRGVRHG